MREKRESEGVRKRRRGQTSRTERETNKDKKHDTISMTQKAWHKKHGTKSII